jgi:hypothetical protein
MKPYDMVSSFRGANTLFKGQQNEGRSEIKRTLRRQKRKQQKTDHRREIKGATRDADQRTRAEEPGPPLDTTSEGHCSL